MLDTERLCGEIARLWTQIDRPASGGFELAAVRQLGSLVGFEGAVWGSGLVCDSRQALSIAQACVLDRPHALLDDYAHVASVDPVTRRFLAAPGEVQAIDVQATYREPALHGFRDYLGAYQVGHLLICGVHLQDCQGVSWLTVYRGPRDRAFTESEAGLFQSLVPLWVQARSLHERLRPREAGAATALGAAAQQPVAGASMGRARVPLSPRESEVLALVARGYTYVEVAGMLQLSVLTVRAHARGLYRKLGAHNRTEAVFEAKLLGLLR